MRHARTNNHLSRTQAHRKALLSNMASSLFLHKKITTTVAKAKALKGYVEPMITKARTDTTHSRRIVFRYLGQKEAVHELFSTVISKVGDRPGGYTRILKIGNRLGDNAEMCMLELVDFNETYTSNKSAGTGKKRRSRRGGQGSAAAKTAAPKPQPAEATAPIAEAPMPENQAEQQTDATEQTEDNQA